MCLLSNCHPHTLLSMHGYSHFTDKKLEAQRSEVTSSGTFS